MAILNIVLPIFLVIGLGYSLRRVGFLREETRGALSRLVFYVSAPALLARATASNSLDQTFNPPVFLVVIVVSILIGAGTYIVCFRSSSSRRGVIAQGAFRSNQVFVGLPVVIYAYGEESVSAVAVLISFVVIIYNFLGAVLLILPQQDKSVQMSTILARTSLGVLRNPLIIACIMGILFSLTGLGLPLALDRALALVGRTAAPLALIVVGAGIDFHRLRNDLRTTILVSLVKTILYPALVFIGLKMLGLSGPDLRLPVMIFASPIAVVSYIMARELGGDEKLASSLVVGSTLISLVTIICWLVFLGPVE